MSEIQIDFVIPYVDGGDPAWAEKKNRYLPKEENVDARERRYRDWEQLRFWFRGVEAFAPWVHKVYLITDHQAPDWLNKDHEKLVLVNHEDYIPKQYLPVFSSHPIELNFHRISGLSEYFVYFNDDMFLTDHVEREDFFRDGLPCDYAVENPIGVNDRTFGHIILNDVMFLNRRYDRREYLRRDLRKHYSCVYMRGALKNLYFSLYPRKTFMGFLYEHTACSFLKSAFSAVWEEDAEGWLAETCTHRFRTDNDVNQYVFRQYQYVHGLYSPYNLRRYGKSFQLDDDENGNITEAVDAVRQGTYKQINLNDAYVKDFEKTKKLLNDAFQSLLPTACSFER